jgi:riboflavin kinase/FMN adenylyltransferase
VEGEVECHFGQPAAASTGPCEFWVFVLDQRRYQWGVLTRKRLDELPALGLPLHLALGVFDGIHVGHQAVIARAVAAAARSGGLAGVLTFDPHPVRALAPERAPASLFATLDQKARIMGSLGIGLFIPLHFDAAMAAMAAADFMQQLQLAPLRTLVVGEDWRFGRGRLGDVDFMRECALRDGFVVEVVPPVMVDGERVSSTRIRQAIRDGSLDAAARMLGRSYSVCGCVIEGRKLGRRLGFPTANIAIHDVITPPDGVWAVRVGIDAGDAVPGIANLGVRPTVDGSNRILEVHIFDFSGDLYGREINIEFVSFLRAEMRFASLDALRDQIQQDVYQARLVHGTGPGLTHLAPGRTHS